MSDPSLDCVYSIRPRSRLDHHLQGKQKACDVNVNDDTSIWLPLYETSLKMHFSGANLLLFVLLNWLIALAEGE